MRLGKALQIDFQGVLATKCTNGRLLSQNSILQRPKINVNLTSKTPISDFHRCLI